MTYIKVRTDIINGKKRCIYMKPKGKREYVKSGGDFVLLSAYIKALQKKIKNKGGGLFDCFGKNSCKKHELAKDTIVTADLGFLKSDDVHEYQVPNAPVNSPRNSIDVNEYDWVERTSTKHKRPYYVDTKTGVSTWKVPSSMKKTQQPSSIIHSNAVTRVFKPY